jgi:hypothetical protein
MGIKGLGTAFVLHEQGYLLIAAHLVNRTQGLQTSRSMWPATMAPS